MPRANRRKRDSEGSDDSLDRLIASWRRTEFRRGFEWNVQAISGERSEKTYRCPGCVQDIPPGTAHLVVWRADGLMGADSDLAARRHWHTHCWRMY